MISEHAHYANILQLVKAAEERTYSEPISPTLAGNSPTSIMLPAETAASDLLWFGKRVHNRRDVPMAFLLRG
jgi:hypothetical protein